MTPVNNVPGNYSLENDLRGDSSPVNNVWVDIFIYRPTLWVGEWILLYDTRLNQQVLLSLMLCVSIPVHIWIQCCTPKTCHPAIMLVWLMLMQSRSRQWCR